MNDLGFLSIKESKEKITKGTLKREDLFQACIENIEETKDFNIFTKYKNNPSKEIEENKSLSGLPVALKDVFSTKEFKTTACSNLLKDYKAPFNAVSVERLLNAGADIIGKVNTDEFTCGASTESSCFGVTKNPYNKEKVAGGSSGGSAAAVNLGTCSFALGTDTGGSIRQPASFCNVVGLKVTYGRVPRSGVISMASSFDTIGPLTRTVEDAAEVLNIIAGSSKKDLTTKNIEVTDYTKTLSNDIKGKVLGIPDEYFGDGIEDSTKELVMGAIAELEKKGAKIKKISLPHTKYGVAVYYVLTPAEVSANMARYDGIRFGSYSSKTKDIIDGYYKTRGEGFGDEMKRRILIGTYVLSAGYYDAYYSKAQKVRTLVCKDFEDAFKEVDAIVAPVSPFSAFKIGELSNDPLANYKADMLTIPSSCAGLPAISVPCGFDDKNMPVGLQIIAPQFREDLVLNLAYKYEEETKWYKK
jgi:aspartyl-tRNA(Asn)/glutamyl-tRNA(Gln) amidotransferase subunit A